MLSLVDRKDSVEATLRERRQAAGPAVRPRVGVGRPAAQQRGPGPGKNQGRRWTRRDSSSSTSSAARPIRTSWPSATWPASPCWPTRPATRARWRPRSLAGQAAAFEPRAIPAVVFTEPEVAWAGLTQTEAQQQDRTVEVAQFPWAASGRAQAIGRTDGLTKWIVDPQSERLLGCGIVGCRRRRSDRRGGAGHRDGRLGPRPGRDRSIRIPRWAKPWAPPRKYSRRGDGSLSAAISRDCQSTG